MRNGNYLARSLRHLHDPGMTPTEVLDALIAGNVDSINEQGDPSFRSSITPQQMRDVWQRAISDWGQCQGAGDGVIVYDLPLTFERGDAHLQVAYRGEQIVGLVLKPGSPTGRFGQ